MDEKTRTFRKQVGKFHYDFANYLQKNRWISIWHQIDEVLSLQPKSLLEIGPGPGLFKILVALFDISVETADIDPELKPNHVVSADDLPFDDNTYDCVCAFQMLEHLPYKKSLNAFEEMVRVAKRNIVISLPDASRVWIFLIHIPNIGQKIFHVPKPFSKKIDHEFNGEHYWEINKKGFPLRKVLKDLISKKKISLIRTYRVPENPYHRFFIFEKNDNPGNKN